ncbi:MAG: 6-phosphofructokinase [Chloroflexi bacterium HGW-Chloroflexi-10]|nr:MAG: 6-phosphofructokinase [Chloroflexi bacterium HGW-Chloroflexi-10]
MSETKYVGVLTSGGDTPGLNAALRGMGKAALQNKWQVIGFYDGFRGLMQNRFLRFDEKNLSGILTMGGTILGTSRDKPNKMPIGGKTLDMTAVMVDNYKNHHLDVLVCLGGGGTQKNAHMLQKAGLNIITLPKTIDNDIALTDVSFGFDTALGIATEAIDRLHSTAHSHHRIIVVEVMGHNTGWLALGAGLAGGADVILIPELPYHIENIAQAILQRSRGGKRFSIVCVSEGALSDTDYKQYLKLQADLEKAKESTKKEQKEKARNILAAFEEQRGQSTLNLSKRLEEITGLEARVTILGHLQRGGTPSAADRLLATRLGTAAVRLIEAEQYGVMVAARGETYEPVPLETVVGKRRIVPPDHAWIRSARAVGTCLGD